jgi:hypothetical protein
MYICMRFFEQCSNSSLLSYFTLRAGTDSATEYLEIHIFVQFGHQSYITNLDAQHCLLLYPKYTNLEIPRPMPTGSGRRKGSWWFTSYTLQPLIITTRVHFVVSSPRRKAGVVFRRCAHTYQLVAIEGRWRVWLRRRVDVPARRETR